jgi:hypothetical protein
MSVPNLSPSHVVKLSPLPKTHIKTANVTVVSKILSVGEVFGDDTCRRK